MRSDRIDTPSGVVLVAQQPAIDELEAQATAQELESVVQYSSPSRRRERLAWRRLVREYLGKEHQIEYLSSGAPIILNSPYKYISVSHSRTHVAVMLSSTPCGVDIESMERDFGRVASRYVSDQEQSLCREEWWPAALWCAKEALYKMAQREGISLRDDIRVCSWDEEHSTLCAELFTGQQVELALKTLQGQMLVYTL